MNRISNSGINYLLHLSHTDIRSDSRILKEMNALATISNCKVIGIGFELNEAEAPADKDSNKQFEILTEVLFTRRWRLLSRSLLYAFNFLELTIKLLLPAIRIKPSVVHCHDTLVLPAGWLIKLATGCKLVYDAHELESNKNGQTVVLSKATFLIEKVVWPRIDLLISVSDHIISWYLTNLGYKKSVLILNSPVFNSNGRGAPNQFFGDDRYFNKHFGIDGDAVIFVYLGILGAGRGIEVSLEAFESGPKNAHVVFVGYGSYEYKIREFSRRCPNIHFHPAVPHEKVVPLVSNADYGLCLVENVSLSDYYSLPNKLFEYSFAGLPILASRFPDISILVEKYALGICCDLDETSIREALYKIVSTRPVFHREDISNLSWGAQAIRLVESYNDLLVSN